MTMAVGAVFVAMAGFARTATEPDPPAALEPETADMPPYDVAEQAWFGPVPECKAVEAKEILSLTDRIEVVIMTATERERDAVLRCMSPLRNRKTILEGPIEQETYYLGQIGLVDVATTKCRAGTLDPGAAILAADHAQRKWHPRALIMVGIAFGADRAKQKIADVLIADAVIPYEHQRRGTRIIYRSSIPPSNTTLINRFDNVSGWVFRRPDGTECKKKVGKLLSGEKLIDDPAFKAELLKEFPEAIGGEMEGAGVCAAAIRINQPWIVVKAICDWADGRKGDKHQDLAAAAAVSLVRHVLAKPDVLHGL